MSMIDATSKSMKWEEINSVKYRFQNLKFNREVIEKLAAPISRREWAMQQLMSHSNDINNVFPTAQEKRRQRRQTTSYPTPFAVENEDTDDDLDEADESVLRRRRLAHGRAQSEAVITSPREIAPDRNNENIPLRYDSESSQFVPMSPRFVPISHDDDSAERGSRLCNGRVEEAPAIFDSEQGEEKARTQQINHNNVAEDIPSTERQRSPSPPNDSNKKNNYVTYKGPFRRILRRRNTDTEIVVSAKTNGFSTIHEAMSDPKINEDDELSGKTREELITLVKELRSQIRAPRVCDECEAPVQNLHESYS